MRTRRFSFTHGCRPGPVALAALLALGAAQPALAQPAAAAPAPVAVSIAAQALTPALNELSRQTGAKLNAAPALLADKSAPAVAGQLSAQQALDQLLAGSGLRATRQPDGSYDISQAAAPRADAAPAAEAGSMTLPSTTISASAGRTEAPQAYAGGQVASGGRMGMLGNKDFMETPFNSISYTDDYVQNLQADQLSRVIALTDPSVFNNGATGMLTDSFTLRGFRVETNDVAYGGLYGLIPYYRVTPELAERIEVLKGPSALINGMPPGGSVGGTINLVPKHAGDVPLTRLTTTYASDSQFGVHADVGRRFGANKELGIRVNGVWRDGDSAVDHQSKSAKLAALGLDWRTDRVRLSADVYGNEDHTRGLNRGVSLAAGVAVPRPPKPTTLLAPDWTFGTTKDHAILLRGEVDVTRNITAYAAYGRGKTDFDALASSVYTVTNAAGDYRNNFAHQRSIYDKDTAEIGARAKFATGSVGHELALSASYYQHDNKFGFLTNRLAQDYVTNIYNPVWGPAIDTSYSNAALSRTGALRTTSYGIADTLSFAQNAVQLTLGVRRQNVISDTYNATTGVRTARYDASATTPAAALLVKVNDKVSVYGNYIEGLSQGPTAPSGAANAGQVFPPAKARQIELGAKYDFGRFASTLSVFQIERPSSFLDPVSLRFRTDGEQRNRGVELITQGEAAAGIRLLAGAAYTQGKLVRTEGGLNDGRSAPATPRFQLNLAGEWDTAFVPGLTFTARALRTSGQQVDVANTQQIPGWTRYDIGARYRFVSGNVPITIRAAIENVAGKNYWQSAAREGLTIGAPRTLLVSLSADF